MVATNRRITLNARPVGVPAPGDFALVTEPLREPGEGEMLVRNAVFALDAAIRGFLDDRPSYLPPVAIGETVRGMALGRVVRSRNPAFAEGDVVRALVGWEEYSIVGGEALGLEKVPVSPDVPLSYYMGTLGPSGLTAYVGLTKIGRLKAGDTVAVTAAAGAVGNVVGQIARLRGARVIALVGSEAKASMCRALGFDAVIDYRATDDLAGAISAAAPGGIDLHWDNVGGAQLDAILPLMADFGRVVVCGMIANYNDAGNQYPIRNLWQVLVKRLTVTGFLTYDHPEMLDEARDALTGWASAGELRVFENVSHGLEATPGAFIDLMAGRTSGKSVVRLDDDAMRKPRR